MILQPKGGRGNFAVTLSRTGVKRKVAFEITVRSLNLLDTELHTFFIHQINRYSTTANHCLAQYLDALEGISIDVVSEPEFPIHVVASLIDSVFDRKSKVDAITLLLGCWLLHRTEGEWSVMPSPADFNSTFSSISVWFGLLPPDKSSFTPLATWANSVIDSNDTETLKMEMEFLAKNGL